MRNYGGRVVLLLLLLLLVLRTFRVHEDRRLTIALFLEAEVLAASRQAFSPCILNITHSLESHYRAPWNLSRLIPNHHNGNIHRNGNKHATFACALCSLCVIVQPEGRQCSSVPHPLASAFEQEIDNFCNFGFKSDQKYIRNCSKIIH